VRACERIKLGGSDRLKGSTVEDTWTSRDLPVLDAVVTLLDRPGSIMATVREIAELTGMEQADIVRALDALDGPYVEFEQFATGGNPGPWRVRRVSSAARREVGQWPTAESMAERLAEAFRAAAEREPDETKRGRLRQIAEAVGGTFKEFTIGVMAEVVGRKMLP
jgi:hypothetical protein